MYRPVAFIRIVRPLAGAPRLKVSLDPAADWGARDAERTSGTNHIRFLTEPQPLRLTTDAPVIHLLEGRSFRLEEPLHFFLGPDEPFVGNVDHDAGDDAAPDRGPLARLGARPRHPARMADAGDPRRDHAEALPARGDRRDRRRDHHLDPRGGE